MVAMPNAELRSSLFSDAMLGAGIPAYVRRSCVCVSRHRVSMCATRAILSGSRAGGLEAAMQYAFAPWTIVRFV